MIKIIEHLGDNRFICEIDEVERGNCNPTAETIKISHDYVQIGGSFEIPIVCDGRHNPVYTPKFGRGDMFSVDTSIKIGIRDMIEIVLPIFKESVFLNSKHINDKVRLEDDKYFKQYGLNNPRWFMGDKYPVYVENSCIFHYKDSKTNTDMVAFRRAGEKHIERVSWTTFKQIENSLKLLYDIYEFE